MEGAGDARIHAHGMRKKKPKWVDVHHDACTRVEAATKIALPWIQ